MRHLEVGDVILATKRFKYYSRESRCNFEAKEGDAFIVTETRESEFSHREVYCSVLDKAGRTSHNWLSPSPLWRKV